MKKVVKMESVIKICETLNIPQLIAMGIIFWFFYSRLDSKIDKLEKKLDYSVERLDKKIDTSVERLDEKLDSCIERLEKKIDRLDEKVTDIDRRVCRIEGSLNSKECCMLKDSRIKEKVE